MTTIKQYIKKDGTKAYMFNAYLGVDPITNKQIRTTRRGFKTKKEAKMEKYKLERQGRKAMTNNNTFQDIYDLYISAYKNSVKESTYAYNLHLYEKYVLPYFSQAKIDKITVTYCQSVVNTWSKDVGSRQNRVKNLASKIFDYATSLTVIAENPLKKVIMPKVVKQVKKEEQELFYTKEELNYFLKCAESLETYKYVFFRILAFSGLRKGEALALTWRDIDFKTNEININKTLARGVRGRLLIQSPKTDTSIRKVALDVNTIQFLKKWKMQQKSDVNNYVFSNGNGKLIQPSAPLEWMNTLISKFSDIKKISIHGFRHTHCSLLFESGATLKEVQDRLGHSDIKTTMNIYAHVTEKAKNNIVEKFSNYIES